MKKVTLICCLLWAIGGGCTVGQGQTTLAPLEISSRTAAWPSVTVAGLSNGLTVIVAENHTTPVVCVRAYVRAGGLYEGKYLGAGISHLLEHLVAKEAVHENGPGQKVATPKQTRSRVDEIGGQSNAYTSLARTCYYISATAGKTDDCIDLVADWMARAAITPEDFAREHQVVQRELEMGRESPTRQLHYAHARNLFHTHPAAVPVIGYKRPLSKLTRQDVIDYHRRMYVPQNMVFAVVGDVDTAKVLARVCKAFGGFERGLAADLSLPAVPPIAKTRRVTVTHPAATDATEQLSFQTIPLVHEDLYALDVLSYVLTHGESSRLVRTIKRQQQLVTSIASSSWTPAWGKGEFTIQFRCQPKQVDQAEEAILDELGKVVAEGVTGEQLARAKRQKVADFVYSQQTVESRSATLVTDYLAAADVGFSRTYTDRIQNVTAEQVQAVAGKYFNFDAMVITRMLPAGAAAEAAAQASPQAAARTRFFKLDNGLRVVLHSTPASGLVSMALVGRGGLLAETPRSNGMGTLMTALSTKGAGDRSAEEIAAFFASAGGSIGGACGNSTFYWRSTVLSDSFQAALPIFADAVLRPTYPAKELAILRPVLLSQLRRVDESWQGRLNKLWRKDFFGDSPLSMMRLGDAEVIEKADRKVIADFHRRHVRAGSAVLAVYGSFDLAATETRIRQLFADMAAGQVEIARRAGRKVAPDGETHIYPSKLTGAAINVAAGGMTVANVDDRLPMAVLDTIISGYHLPRGWLHEKLRGEGLVYVVHAYNFPALVPGAFAAYAHCEPDKAPQVAAIIRQKFRQTLTHKFTQAEVDEAVNMILTADLLNKQSMSALAMEAALNEVYGLGYDFHKTYEQRLRALTAEDVARVARKYLSGGYVTTVLTPQPQRFQE